MTTLRVRRFFEIKSSIAVADMWPIEIDGYEFEWCATGNVLTSLCVTRVVLDSDILPTIGKDPDRRVAAHINLGRLGDHELLKSILLRIQAVLALFSNIEINFSSEKTEFVPESPEEENALKKGISSYSGGYVREDPFKPRPLGFDMVGRITAHHGGLSDLEVALSFFRRGRQEFQEENYILSYYNCYFLLETLLAEGKHRNKEVEAKFRDSSQFIQALGETRRDLKGYQGRGSHQLQTLLLKSDSDIAKHLVETRGHLHHHNPGKPNNWHPERQDAYLTDSLLLMTLAHYLAIRFVMPRLFSEEAGSAFFTATEKAGAISTLVLKGRARSGGKLAEMAPVQLRLPGNIVSREMVAAADKQFRSMLVHSDFKNVVDYTIFSDDESHVYARYERVNDEVV